MRSLVTLILGIALAPVAWPAQPTDFQFTRIDSPAEPNAIPLYSGVAPGSESHKQTEIWDRIMGERIVRNVTKPTITPFLSDPSKATGAAVARSISSVVASTRDVAQRFVSATR
jgi:hypothetical protein